MGVEVNEDFGWINGLILKMGKIIQLVYILGEFKRTTKWFEYGWCQRL